MMPTDTLTCRVTPDSVEPDSLACSMPPLEWLSLWATVGSIATAIFTLVLAIFAVAAWRSSVRNLQAIDRHNQESIRANQDVAVQSQQIQYLAEYCAALMDLSNAAGDPKIRLEPLLAATTTTWATWAMELFRIDSEFRDITGKWNAALKSRCQSLHEIVSKETENYGMSITRLAEHDATRSIVGSYFAKLQIWQVDVTKRYEVKTRLIENYRASK